MVKITVYVPEDLLRRAMKESGLGITATIPLGLEALVKRAEAERRFMRRLHAKPH